MARSDGKLRNAKPKDKPYKLADVSKLFVQANPPRTKKGFRLEESIKC